MAVPLRVLNLSDNEVCLKQDEEIGQVELCSDAEFQDFILEEAVEKQDLQSVRKIKLGIGAVDPIGTCRSSEKPMEKSVTL